MEIDKKPNKTPFKSTGRLSGGGWWVFFIWVFTFLSASLLTLAMSAIMHGADVIIAVIILLGIILFSIFFDIIGNAAITATETPFNSMAAQKVYGAKTALMLIKNADKVSNFCIDVIGDVLGIISGSILAFIIFRLSYILYDGTLTDISAQALLGGFVAALTVGGKLYGKRVAINNCNSIVYRTAVVIQFFKRKGK